MFDTYAQELLERLPHLPGLTPHECRRYLSKAYFFILREKLELDRGIPEQDFSAVSEVASYLRNLANTLETIAIFDSMNGIEVPLDVQKSCAFVAAEALSLLKSMIQSDTVAASDSFQLESNYVALESGLLYMYGGYDVNAVSVTAQLQFMENTENVPLVASARELVTNIQRLCQGDVRNLPLSSADDFGLANDGQSFTYSTLIDDIRVRFYSELSRGILLFLQWVAGEDDAELDDSVSILRRVHRAATMGGVHGNTEFTDIYHFSSILMVTVRTLSTRSAVYAVPEPETDDETFLNEFRSYLRQRARGTGKHRGRPYLWPTALEYIQSCLPGPTRDCVIAMPTGSGKSFVAELAISHALSSGWVLYLAPTNALAHQIRRDLKQAFHAMSTVEVHAFVGGGEYSQLQDSGESMTDTYIAVMTPEKCSLALRLQPERFENCTLCVFDECHLLNEEGRGQEADIVLAGLMNVSPNIKFLLMSAMISNAEELAEWLRMVHDSRAVAAPIKWRPSRTLRGLAVLDSEPLNRLFQDAKRRADHLTGKRDKHVLYDVPLGLLVGLSGPWTGDGAEDYLLRRLPVRFQAKATKGEENPNPKYESWKNTASRLIAERFAKAGIPVINFLLSSRHHAFSSAARSSESMPGISSAANFEPIVKAWLQIADAELGVPTVLWELFEKGIAVHNSAMLQVEQAASEWMFVNQHVKLMFATGTLAQGLNLPAVAVVISGTSLGDSREEVDSVYGLSRVNSLILNGFGRAGRPGFSNQGIGILVSDRPYAVPVGQEVNSEPILRQYSVLGENDASVAIHSPLERFISTVTSGSFDPETATPSELTLTSLLMENGEIDTGRVLSKTLGAFHVYRGRQGNWVDEARMRLKEVRDNFITAPGHPDWLNSVAAMAGVDFFRASRMLDAYRRRGIPDTNESRDYSVLDWLKVFIGVLSLMPPKRFLHIIPDDTYKGNTVLRRLRDAIGDARYIDQPDWNPPDDWIPLWLELCALLQRYMEGENYAELARTYLSIEGGSVRNGRSAGGNPIPAVFKLIRTVFEPLAIDAGCFVALSEQLVFADRESIQVPDELQALPLCIRYGCDSLGTLSWFRFGIRQRTCAHALQTNYPLPQDLESEELRAKWVRNSRRQWLGSEANEDELLRSARLIVTHGHDLCSCSQ